MSLRTRVLLAMTVIAFMVLASAVVTRQRVQQQLIDQVDTRLDFGGFAEGRGPRPGDRNPGQLIPRDSGGLPRGLIALYFASVGTDGALHVVSTPTVRGVSLAAPAIRVEVARARAKSGVRAPFTVSATGSRDLEYRVVVRVDDRDGTIRIVGAPLNEVADSVAKLDRIVFSIAGIVLLALAIVTWWVIRLGVRPVKRMAVTATSVAGSDDAALDLSQRVDVAAAGTEIGELGRALNVMLDRVQSSFDERVRTENRLRQFVGDASHELRTPVQTVRGYAELYRLGALSDPSKLDDAMRRSEQEAVRMAALVDDLLTLARFDNERPLRHDPVDLVELARDAVANVAAIQPSRAIMLDGDGEATITGDDHALRQVLANVIGNALVHTPVESGIHVAIGVDAEAIITVTDEGPGMSADIAEHAFERFARADQARTRHAGGAGLGLAIVEATVVAHGGTVALTSSVDGGTTVTVRLPRP